MSALTTAFVVLSFPAAALGLAYLADLRHRKGSA